MMMEYEKYQELQTKSQRMQEDYECKLVEAEERKEVALEELTDFYENKLQEMVERLEQVQASPHSTRFGQIHWPLLNATARAEFVYICASPVLPNPLHLNEYSTLTVHC